MTEKKGAVPPLARALAARGFIDLTPVQQAMLDPAIESADLLVSARTGSGKTVAFGIAMAPTLLGAAERFDAVDAPLALVVAPTRELALQVRREFDWLYAEAGIATASCVGGMDMRSERRALQRGAHVVVGTPGRLRDHIQRGSLDLGSVRVVVLDEADEMLDMGFREDLEFILEAAPASRRTLMFSATVPKQIAALAKRYQRDAVRVETTTEREQHGDIEYRAMSVANHDRENAIINVLRYYEAPTALVFCTTRAAVSHMTARFQNRGFPVVALSGELSQTERTHALQAMRDGRARVCIATDVAARGIDLPNLDLVIHADLPTNRDTLLHRSGRTGRAGRKGVSVLIVPVSGRRRAEGLLRAATIKAQWVSAPSAAEIIARDDSRLLTDPALADPVGEDEAAMVARIMEGHSPEQVAAAFLRLARAGQSAPEELDEAPAPRDPNAPRPEFGESVWLSLSVGRNQNAEPRWLLPLICGASGLTKRDIGAIRMQSEETWVQMAAGKADAFFAALGPEMTLEKGVVAKRLESAPGSAGAPGLRSKRPLRGPKAKAQGKPRPKKAKEPPAGPHSAKAKFKKPKARG